mgnify:FL=1
MAASLAIAVLFAGSFIIVRIAAVAMRLTGLPENVARFQSVSALTGAGFTTSESEMIVHYPARRRIVVILMVLGNLGLVSTASTLIVSFAVILVVMLNKTLDVRCSRSCVFYWSGPPRSAPAASIDYCNSMTDIVWRSTSTVVMRLRRLVTCCRNSGRCNCSAYAAMERIGAVPMMRRTWSDPVVY